MPQSRAHTSVSLSSGEYGSYGSTGCKLLWSPVASIVAAGVGCAMWQQPSIVHERQEGPQIILSILDDEHLAGSVYPGLHMHT